MRKKIVLNSEEAEHDPSMSLRERRDFANKLLVAVDGYFEKVNTPETRDRKAKLARQHAASVDFFNQTGQLLIRPPPPAAQAEQLLRSYLDEQLHIIKPALITLSKAVDKIVRRYVELGYRKGYLFDNLIRNTYSSKRQSPFEVVRGAVQQFQANGLPSALQEIIISETQDFIDTVDIFEDRETREERVQYIADKIYFKAFEVGLME